MATVRIKLRNSSVPGRAGSVYYQITHRQKSVQITTGYKLLPGRMGRRQAMRRTRPADRGDYYLRKVQRAIDSDLSVLKNAIGALERAAGHYTAHDVAQAFRESHSGETFFGFMERQIEQLLAHGRLGTARNYRRTRQSFSQFLHGEDLSFAGCTAELVADYEQWLKRRGVTRNTVSFYMRILRSVYNKAVGEGIASQRAPFEKSLYGRRQNPQEGRRHGHDRKPEKTGFARLPVSGLRPGSVRLQFLHARNGLRGHGLPPQVGRPGSNRAVHPPQNGPVPMHPAGALHHRNYPPLRP